MPTSAMAQYRSGDISRLFPESTIAIHIVCLTKTRTSITQSFCFSPSPAHCPSPDHHWNHQPHISPPSTIPGKRDTSKGAPTASHILRTIMQTILFIHASCGNPHPNINASGSYPRSHEPIPGNAPRNQGNTGLMPGRTSHIPTSTQAAGTHIITFTQAVETHAGVQAQAVQLGQPKK